jgi:hypothetical protein
MCYLIISIQAKLEELKRMGRHKATHNCLCNMYWDLMKNKENQLAAFAGASGNGKEECFQFHIWAGIGQQPTRENYYFLMY